jgi:eukaryotic-like serine/threonine-protein kinase
MSFVCETGAKVSGRYELRRLLGEGGMGEVWAGVHLVTRRPVALKFLKGDAGKDARHRFIREARAASVVHHPNVVPMIDILELEDGAPVLVMDLLEGITLAELLARRGKLELPETAAILMPVISAVGSAHALGIVHRDLKPANIFLIDREDGAADVRVLDFGVAKFTASTGDAAETAHLTRTGEVLGTPYYMPPEQVFGEHDVDHRADIWSMGVILYECLAGCRPFEGSNAGQILKAIMMGKLRPLQDVAPRVPDTVSSLVGRMLTLERSERPSDLREVMEILRLFSDVHVQSFGTARFVPVPKQPIDPYSETTFAPPSKRRWPLAAAAAALCLLAGAGVMWKLRTPEIVPRNVVVAPPPALVQPPPVEPPKPAVVEVSKPVVVEPARPSKPEKHHSSVKKPPPPARPQPGPEKKKLPGGVVDEVPF